MMTALQTGVRTPLALTRISELKEHEQIDPFHLEELKGELVRDGYQRDPITVDADYKVILDGHHRVKILKALGCSKVATHYVDYLNNPNIRVKAWYPVVIDSERSLLKLLRENGINADAEAQGRAGHLVLRDRTITVKSDRRRVMGVLVGKVRMDYVPSEAFAKKLVETGRVSCAIIFDPISKEDVIEAALSGDPFPPKTTRHIFATRPRNWFILLRDLT
jgi:hypothetical protein